MNNGQVITIDADRFDIDVTGPDSAKWTYDFYCETEDSDDLIATFKYIAAYGVSLASFNIESNQLALPVFNTPLLKDNLNN